MRRNNSFQIILQNKRKESPFAEEIASQLNSYFATIAILKIIHVSTMSSYFRGHFLTY